MKRARAVVRVPIPRDDGKANEGWKTENDAKETWCATMQREMTREVFAFVAYARDILPERLDVLIANDDEEEEEEENMKRERNGIDGVREMRGRRTIGERRVQRCAKEASAWAKESLTVEMFRTLKPEKVIMALGTTANRMRERYDIDFTRVRAEGRAWGEKSGGYGRRAVRAFVPLAATCAPPQSNGLRASFFVTTKVVVSGDGGVSGYTLKRGFKPIMKDCERRTLRVEFEVDGGDDARANDGVVEDDDDDDEDVMWYQADLAIRAVPSNAGGDED